MNQASLQYLSDKNGEMIAAIVPIDLWREIRSEDLAV